MRRKRFSTYSTVERGKCLLYCIQIQCNYKFLMAMRILVTAACLLVCFCCFLHPLLGLTNRSNLYVMANSNIDRAAMLSRPFHRKIRRTLSRRPGVEVFDSHSNESIISAAKWIFDRRNPGFVFKFVPASWNSSPVRLAEGVHISSSPASHLSWAFHLSSKISRKTACEACSCD